MNVILSHGTPLHPTRWTPTRNHGKWQRDDEYVNIQYFICLSSIAFYIACLFGIESDFSVTCYTKYLKFDFISIGTRLVEDSCSTSRCMIARLYMVCYDACSRYNPENTQVSMHRYTSDTTAGNCLSHTRRLFICFNGMFIVAM